MARELLRLPSVIRKLILHVLTKILSMHWQQRRQDKSLGLHVKGPVADLENI